MTKSTKLSATAHALLAAAIDRDDRLALPPERIPAAAKRAVVQSLLKAGLLEEIEPGDDQPVWRTDEDGLRFALRVTEAGLRATGTDVDGERPNVPGETTKGAPAAPERALETPCAPEGSQPTPSEPAAVATTHEALGVNRRPKRTPNRRGIGTPLEAACAGSP